MGVLCQVKTQSSKICLNFNFWGGEGGTLPSQNSKFQDLPKFQFLRGGGGVLCQVKTQSSKICLQFQFSGGGWGGTLPSQNSKFQDLPKFQFSGWGVLSAKSKLTKCQDLPKFQFSWGEGGYSTVLRVGHSQNFEPKFTVQPETFLIALLIESHILTYVETRNIRSGDVFC